jgi:1-deoxy-D-xylulose-5-phosphate synthase
MSGPLLELQEVHTYYGKIHALKGISLAVMDARFAVPLDEGAILGAVRPGGAVITAEEGVLAGGFGSGVRELLDREGRFDIRFLSVGLPIEPYPCGKTGEIKSKLGLDAAGLAARIRAFHRGG